MYRLLADYRITEKEHRICVPILFKFDGASVPSFGWTATYTPFHPVVITAACVHDWLYSNHQVERDVADDIFHEILIKAGAERDRAWIMWQAVRVGGGWAWEHNDKDIQKLQTLYEGIKHREKFDDYHFPMEVL